MCFTAGVIESFLLWLILVCVVIGVLRIIVPWILSLAGIGIDGQVMRIINLIVIGIVLCFVVVICFDLFSCIAGGGGFGPHLVR